MAEYEAHQYDVVVVGAGGAGLRAAMEATAQGARTALVCKSLLGKAHTVMAEGGIAAALGNVYPEDNWRVHFRDTMRGGKFMNNWRMAQLHAQEAPDRVNELEDWGALFDRTEDGRILQRDFGGHRYARLAHVGDRTGLELIRTLQHQAVSRDIDVFMECTIIDLLQDGGRIAGAFGYWRETGRFVAFQAPAVVLATGGIGKAYKVTSNSWEYTGDGHALALAAGADLIDMEFVQFHPTGMVWPVSVRGILVTEGVRRRRRGPAELGGGTVHVPVHLRDVPQRDRGDRGRGRSLVHRQADPLAAPLTCCPATKWPGPSLPRSRRGEVRRTVVCTWTSPPGVTPTTSGGGSPPCTTSSGSSPTSTSPRNPMEVGPTCHYMMGGVRVDAETQESNVPGLFAAGEVAGGMHGANRLGGNSLSDLLVFGARAGYHAAAHAGSAAVASKVPNDELDALANVALRPFDDRGTENPYTVQQDLQDCMNALVGIIRTEGDLRKALDELEVLKERAERVRVEGNRRYNPGWHLALDLISLLSVSECVTRAALERKESRGAQTRDDYPESDEKYGRLTVVVRQSAEELLISTEPLPDLPADVRQLVEEE